LTPAGIRAKWETPQATPRRLPCSPRKASSWSGKERTTFIIKKTIYLLNHKKQAERKQEKP
jgi:hypothetical protein